VIAWVELIKRTRALAAAAHGLQANKAQFQLILKPIFQFLHISTRCVSSDLCRVDCSGAVGSTSKGAGSRVAWMLLFLGMT
jgi:hypothetical protein